MSLPDNKVLLTAIELNDWFKTFSLSRRGFKDLRSQGVDPFEDLKRRLENAQINSEKLERAALKNHFHVNTLTELQANFDKINNSPLMNFGASYLNDNPEFWNKLQSPSYDTLANALVSFFSNSDNPEVVKIYDGIVQSQNITDDVVEALIKTSNLKMLVEKTREERGNSTSVSMHHFKTAIHDLLQYAVIDNKVKKSISRTYKKDLKLTLNAQGPSTWVVTTQIDEDEIAKGELSLFSYYPYYNLYDETQKRLAADRNGPVWKNFKEHIKNYLSGIPMLSPSLIDNVLEQYGPTAFFQYEHSGVKGILGELQAALIFTALTGHPVIPTGDAQNKLSTNKGKLGADILLDPQTGIQVKNYTGYKEGSGFHLNGNLKWNEVQSRVGRAPDFEAVEEYLTVTSYNKRYKFAKGDAPGKYNQVMNNINRASGTVKRAIEAVLASNLGAFIRLEEKYSIFDDTIQDSYRNLFYVFHGDTIIPISYVLKSLLEKILGLEKAIMGNKRIERFSFTANVSSYTGPTYGPDSPEWSLSDFYFEYGLPSAFLRDERQGPPRERVSMQEVLSKIGLHYNLNIYLGDLNLTKGALN